MGTETSWELPLNTPSVADLPVEPSDENTDESPKTEDNSLESPPNGWERVVDENSGGFFYITGPVEHSDENAVEFNLVDAQRADKDAAKTEDNSASKLLPDGWERVVHENLGGVFYFQHKQLYQQQKRIFKYSTLLTGIGL